MWNLRILIVTLVAATGVDASYGQATTQPDTGTGAAAIAAIEHKHQQAEQLRKIAEDLQTGALQKAQDGDDYHKALADLASAQSKLDGNDLSDGDRSIAAKEKLQAKSTLAKIQQDALNDPAVIAATGAAKNAEADYEQASAQSSKVDAPDQPPVTPVSSSDGPMLPPLDEEGNGVGVHYDKFNDRSTVILQMIIHGGEHPQGFFLYYMFQGQAQGKPAAGVVLLTKLNVNEPIDEADYNALKVQFVLDDSARQEKPLQHFKTLTVGRGYMEMCATKADADLLRALTSANKIEMRLPECPDYVWTDAERQQLAAFVQKANGN